MDPQMLIIKAVIFVRTSGPRLLKWFKSLGWKKLSIGVGIIVLVVGGIAFVTRKSAVTDAPTVLTKSVEVKSIAELSALSTPFSVVGQITSKSEATVRAEHSGQVISINKALGDTVTAGSIVAELENASERAAVLQAQGSVDAAQANLSKVTGGARSEQLAILQSALDAALSGAVNTLLSAYSSIDSGVRGTTDKMFSNPGKTGSTFNILSSDTQLTNTIENMRFTVEQYLLREDAISDTLTSFSNLSDELTTAQKEIREIRNFLDMIVSALNKGIPTPSISESALATYLREATAARATVNATLSLIASTRQALETATNNLAQGVTGGQPEDVAAAQASLKQAQGGLAAARANLEKTIIRAPISGTINSFSLKLGDYVQVSTPVLTVANNSSLEVVAYITGNDAREIAVGQKATLDKASGVVTRIAPALDPITKKIEVRIGVDKTVDLINGQSVLVSIARTTVATGEISRITIPISAIKVETDRTVVFTVAPDSTLVAHPVLLGALLGDRVMISSGVTNDMSIVTDARGLREGDIVTLK
jgi:RND family efflux transporter MFP subunit